MKKSAAEREVRVFVRDWSDYDSQEHYTVEDVDACYSELSDKHPDLLVGVDTQNVRAWIEQELDQNAQNRKFKRQAAI